MPKTRTDTKPRTKATHPAKGQTKAPTPAQVLRGDLDELAVQADLAGLDVRDAVGTRIEAAVNAWLAARHRLEMAVRDADKVVGDLRQVVGDLLQVLPDADQAINRTKAAR